MAIKMNGRAKKEKKNRKYLKEKEIYQVEWMRENESKMYSICSDGFSWRIVCPFKSHYTKRNIGTIFHNVCTASAIYLLQSPKLPGSVISVHVHLIHRNTLDFNYYSSLSYYHAFGSRATKFMITFLVFFVLFRVYNVHACRTETVRAQKAISSVNEIPTGEKNRITCENFRFVLRCVWFGTFSVLCCVHVIRKRIAWH